MKNRKGITLIALIITIIVMLILAGVSISLVVGDNGVIKQTKGAAEAKRVAEIEEALELYNESEYIRQKTGLGDEGDKVEYLEEKGLITSEEAEEIMSTGKLKIGNSEVQIGDVETLKLTQLKNHEMAYENHAVVGLEMTNISNENLEQFLKKMIVYGAILDDEDGKVSINKSQICDSNGKITQAALNEVGKEIIKVANYNSYWNFNMVPKETYEENIALLKEKLKGYYNEDITVPSGISEELVLIYCAFYATYDVSYSDINELLYDCIFELCEEELLNNNTGEFISAWDDSRFINIDWDEDNRLFLMYVSEPGNYTLKLENKDLGINLQGTVTVEM